MANGNSVLPLFEASPFRVMVMPFSKAASRAPTTGALVVRSVSGNVDDPPQP